MAETTKIGWTDHTFNPWWGCHKVSAECTHCYIDGIMRRGGYEPFKGPMRTSHASWQKPLTWNRKARRSGERRRVFTCSMSDFFHPGADAWRPEAWKLISQCEWLDWLILTKRPELIRDRLPPDWNDGYANVWLGVTAGISSSLHRVALLKTIPARIRFISAEPLLERLDLREHIANGVHWVITGCERAAKGERRLMDMVWVRDIHQQCEEAGVAHFFKQRYIDDRGVPVEDGLLDGRVCQAWPQVGAAHQLAVSSSES